MYIVLGCNTNACYENNDPNGLVLLVGFPLNTSYYFSPCFAIELIFCSMLIRHRLF